jgi:hypothetical protein
MSRSTLNIEHIRLIVDKSFEAFTASFDQQLGCFDAAVYNELDGGDTQKAKVMLNSMVGLGPPGSPMARRGTPPSSGRPCWPS